MLTLTGHAEIDQQHELLESAVGRLAVFCSEAADHPDITCSACNPLKQKHCRTVLASIAGDLGATRRRVTELDQFYRRNTGTLLSSG